MCNDLYMQPNHTSCRSDEHLDVFDVRDGNHFQPNLYLTVSLHFENTFLCFRRHSPAQIPSPEQYSFICCDDVLQTHHDLPCEVHVFDPVSDQGNRLWKTRRLSTQCFGTWTGEGTKCTVNLNHLGISRDPVIPSQVR